MVNGNKKTSGYVTQATWLGGQSVYFPGKTKTLTGRKIVYTTIRWAIQNRKNQMTYKPEPYETVLEVRLQETRKRLSSNAHSVSTDESHPYPTKHGPYTSARIEFALDE